ncbi:MAG TPA: hypothetical protein VM662_03640 [Sphingomonas sp.]|nr:hypothetical protein [Sphingomonas sp.]
MAGLDLDNHQMLRPLQSSGANWEEAKWVKEGYMQVGNVISIEPAAAATSDFPHRTEDCLVAKVGILGQATPAQLYSACIETADDSINDLFSGSLIDNKFVNAGTDCRSLGCVLVVGSELRVSGAYDKVQISYSCGFGDWQNLTVTDLAIKSCESSAVGAATVQQQIAGAGNQYMALRVGLARAWDGPDHNYDPKRCYIQLNGLISPV